MKSVGSARAAWRCRKRTRMPGKVIQTPKGFFMCREDYNKMVAAQGLDAATLATPVFTQFRSLPIHITEACGPYWLETRPLCRWSARYLQRHAQRRGR